MDFYRRYKKITGLMMMKRHWTLAILIVLLLSACQPAAVTPAEQASTEAASLTLTSPAFNAGEPIPVQYTCDGEDISPALNWSAPPEGTQSFALIMDDPDAPSGDYVHWVLYNLPAVVRTLSEAVPGGEPLPDGGLQGRNGWRNEGYGGPCPPSGTHRYFFKLYALDSLLDAGPGLSKQELLEAIQGHVLAYGELMGTFSR